MAKKQCTTGNWGCIYHACMSDDCQKEHVLKSGLDWGDGMCSQSDDNDPPGVYSTCPWCGNWFDDADYDFQTCHICGWSND